jgi:hypothetical protein
MLFTGELFTGEFFAGKLMQGKALTEDCFHRQISSIPSGRLLLRIHQGAAVVHDCSDTRGKSKKS